MKPLRCHPLVSGTQYGTQYGQCWLLCLTQFKFLTTSKMSKQGRGEANQLPTLCTYHKANKPGYFCLMRSLQASSWATMWKISLHHDALLNRKIQQRFSTYVKCLTLYYLSDISLKNSPKGTNTPNMAVKSRSMIPPRSYQWAVAQSDHSSDYTRLSALI